uniref:Uncharacterized protein n=1 Tax=Ditylenchus dipsaci TaxID=166011 RepID=A0A915DB97_9BILA
MSRVNPSRVFKPLPACQLKGPNVTKTILRQREQLAKLPGFSVSNSKISTTTRYGPRGANCEQQSKKIEELKAELEKANAAVRIANGKVERLNRENSLLQQKVRRLEAANNPGGGIASAFQSSQRQRIPIRTKNLQKRRSRSVGGKPGRGGFYYRYVCFQLRKFTKRLICE